VVHHLELMSASDPSASPATRAYARDGRLKVVLGAAAGVGKTYAMLGEARDLVAAGVDVVVGYLEAHGRRATEDRAGGMEVAPRRTVRVGGRPFTEMDVDWLLERHPQLCLVDELAHTNLPGGRNAKRWQDVEELLHAGIDVYTTVNIQHLESLNDKIFELTGVRVRETFPDRLLEQADSVVLIDLPPDALRERIAQGRVYAPEKIATALNRFFKLENLAALRALALREVAERQEEAQPATEPATAPKTAERILVCVDGRPNSEGLVRRAARLARRVGGRLWFLHIEADDERLGADELGTIDRAAALAARLGGTVLRREGNVAQTVVDVATELGVTWIVLGESHRPRWREAFGQSIIAHVLRATDGIDVLIVADARARAETDTGMRVE
jgi:two-component system, OmpR family, sensor histidine kinase KdpD